MEMHEFKQRGMYRAEVFKSSVDTCDKNNVDPGVDEAVVF